MSRASCNSGDSGESFLFEAYERAGLFHVITQQAGAFCSAKSRAETWSHFKLVLVHKDCRFLGQRGRACSF